MGSDEITSEQAQHAVDLAFGRKATRDADDKLWLAEQIPTREEIERIEAAAALDDDLDPDLESDVDDDGTHPVDPDPYGWIAGVEAAHPDFVQNSRGEQIQVRPEHVEIWVHGFPQPDRFDHAVAKVLPTGALLVMRTDSPVPLKGYAPNVWLTFEHVGEQYHARPPKAVGRPSRPGGRVQTTSYAAQERAAVSMARSNAMLAEHADEAVRVFTDPVRRTPPTFEADADDTQNIPVVKPDQTQVGGGVARPFGSGAPEGAVSTAPTPRPATADAGPDGPTPGRFRSLWRSLTGPYRLED